MDYNAVQDDLLEFLYQKTGCTFLSDLHCIEWFPQIKEAVKEIAANQFSLKQWQGAAHYISRQPIDLTEAEDVRQLLLNLPEE